VDALASVGDEGRGVTAISSGEPLAGYDPEISEWGNPSRVIARHRRVNQIARRGDTGGSETSQYPEEKKTNPAFAGPRFGGGDSLSSGERNGNSLNLMRVKACVRCACGVMGACRTGTQAGREVKKPSS